VRLRVAKSIAIDASAEQVWRVLTSPELTSQWAVEFGASGPIESTWRLGSPVLWRNAQGEVYVFGRVTALEPGKLLAFTVCSTQAEMRPTSGRDEDEIAQTYTLSSRGARTVLTATHGDFAQLAGGEQIFPRVVELWDRLLPKIQELAEGIVSE
jgi:uncharacterized protein YndB with AHSA1/START domain